MGIGASGTYEYRCCDESVDIYQVLNGGKGDSGCETQMHGTSYIYGLQKHKEQKIIDRIIAHQLIIMENPGGQIIDKLEFSGDDREGAEVEGNEG